MLKKLDFYKELNVIKTDHAFKGNEISYKVELVEKKIQLNSQKRVIRVLNICLAIFQMKQKVLSTNNTKSHIKKIQANRRN